MKKDLLILLSIAITFTFFSLILFWPIFWGKVNLNGNLLVSFYPLFGENLPFKYTGLDQLRIYFPFYKVTFEAFRQGVIPFWNIYAFSGHPHMADFQSAVFYPLNLAGLFLPQIEFWHFLRITPTILASFFTFLYLRALKLSNLASFFGAFTFGFSPFILTWGEEVVMAPHSIVWLPLVLFGMERYLEIDKRLLLRHLPDRNDNRGKYLVIISFAVALSLLGGYIQTSIYMLIFVVAYLVFRLFLGGWKGFKSAKSIKSLKITAAIVLGVGISAVALLPSAELYFNSARAEIALRESIFGSLLPAESLLTFLAPDFFGNPATYNFFRLGGAQYYEGILFVGIAALVFAIFSIFNIQQKDRHYGLVIFLSLFGLLALSTTMSLPTSRFLLSLPIPFLSTSIANRILFVSAFCIAVLGALGVERWLISADKKIYKTIFAVFCMYLLIVLALAFIWTLKLEYFKHGSFLSQNNVIVSLRNLVVPFSVFISTSFLLIWATGNIRFKKIALVLIIFVAAFQIFYFTGKYFSFSARKYVFPEVDVISYLQKHQGFWRSWSVGDSVLENNFGSQYGLFGAGGYDSLNNKSYGEFTYAMQGGNLDSFAFRADAGLGRGEAADLLGHFGRRRLMNMVGVKYVTAPTEDSEVFEKSNFTKVFNGEKFSVFENNEVLARVFLASNYEGPPDIFGHEPKTVAQKNQRDELRRRLIVRKLLDEDFNLNTLILEKPSFVSPQFGQGSADIVSYKPNEVIVKTSASEPKILFLSDNYYPGWKATVDGDKTTILRANYTFRAVPLVGGEHIVRFWYDGNIFKVGILISTLSFLITLGFLVKFKGGTI